jgi:putative restriction endonuclease
MSLQTSYYRNVILSIHRGWKNGLYSNAKPLFLLTIIKGIEDGFILGNRIPYSKEINLSYKLLCQKYEPNTIVTPFFKPYYHFIKDDFYNIKWKTVTNPPHKWHTPSGKFLTENVDYAYLDDTLWELLQDKDIREEYKEAIITHYLKAE